MRGALRSRDAPLVVDLRRGDVAVAEQVLHLSDIDAGVEQQRGGGSAQRVGSVGAAADGRAVLELFFSHRARHAVQIPLNHPVHRGRVHRPIGELLSALRRGLGPEEGTGGQAGFFDVFNDRLRGIEVKPDRSALVSLLVQLERRLLSVLVKVRDLQPAACRQSNPGIEINLEDRSIAVIDQVVAHRHSHQLPRPGRRQGFGFVAGIGRAARDELRVGWIGHRDRQPELGRGGRQIFIEGREGRNPPQDGLRRHAGLVHQPAPVKHVRDRDLEQIGRIPGPVEFQKLDEAHHVGPVRATRMRTMAALDPGLEDLRHRQIELLNAAGHLRRLMAGENRRQMFARGAVEQRRQISFVVRLRAHKRPF